MKSFFNKLLFFFSFLFISNAFAITSNNSDDENDRRLLVRNAISPNGDSKNDFFVIEGITNPENINNEVKIYNRWGVEVFSIKGYNGDVPEKNLNSMPKRAFYGISDARLTFGSDQKLPTGTYYYTIRINNNGAERMQAGYLYINN